MGAKPKYAASLITKIRIETLTQTKQNKPTINYLSFIHVNFFLTSFARFGVSTP